MDSLEISFSPNPEEHPLCNHLSGQKKCTSTISASCFLFSPNAALVEGYPSKQNPWTGFLKMASFNQVLQENRKRDRQRENPALLHIFLFFGLIPPSQGSTASLSSFFQMFPLSPQKHPHRHTQIIFKQVSGHPVRTSS